MTPTLAYAGRPGADLAGAIAAFGTDWLYVLVPFTALVATLVWLARRSPLDKPAGFLRRAAHGASDVTALPAWCAGPMVLLVYAYLFAVTGFFWDVAWHISVGRDEFLFSPPHVALLIGLGLLGVAGLTSASTATRDRAQTVGWQVDRWRVPYGAAALIVAGGAAMIAFGVDELWHAAYGLDVTMWSPPHLTMISAAALSPIASLILLAEAGRGTGNALVRRHLRPFLAAALVIGLSAWQLEFDLGVPQWQHLFHPVLVAIAAGFGLTAARVLFGRWGALLAVAWFAGIRLLLTGLTAWVWGFSVPRFVPYLAAALAVEAAFHLLRDRRTPALGLAAGVGVGTVGLAGAAAFTHLWAWHAWTTSLVPEIAIASVAAVAAAVLGTGFGRVVAHRSSGLSAPVVAVALGVLALTLALPIPRTTPDAEVTVHSTPATPGWAHVEVTVEPPEAVAAPDRFEVMSWQGDGHQVAALEPLGGGRFAADRPVPVDGEWKTVVRLGDGPRMGAFPISMPADPEIDAAAVPHEPTMSGPFQLDSDVLLREAREGPAWPGLVGYTFVVTSIGGMIALLLAGAVALDRRTRATPSAPGTRSAAREELSPPEAAPSR